jgi:Holliday junction resolvase RusA-like endonuclease
MRGRTPVTGPLALTVVAMLAIPKSWSKKKQAAALAGQERPTARPDWDNFGKVTDALNGIVWVDDAQVVEAMVIKRYAERPCLRIEVEEIEHGEGLCAPGGDPA